MDPTLTSSLVVAREIATVMMIGTSHKTSFFSCPYLQEYAHSILVIFHSQEGLVCFQRYNAFEAVPACSGGANDPSLSDYCVRPTDRHTVDDPTPPPVPPPTPAPFDPTPKIDPYAGESSHTLSAVPIKWSTNFPLALCEGDCDSDFDCTWFVLLPRSSFFEYISSFDVLHFYCLFHFERSRRSDLFPKR